jgi:hypothetical protein
MLMTVPRTLRQALPTRGTRRTDGPGRLVGAFALAGAAMMTAAVVLAVRGAPWWWAGLLTAGALVQSGGFLGAMWWTLRHPPTRCDRRPH